MISKIQEIMNFTTAAMYSNQAVEPMSAILTQL